MLVLFTPTVQTAFKRYVLQKVTNWVFIHQTEPSAVEKPDFCTTDGPKNPMKARTTNDPNRLRCEGVR